MIALESFGITDVGRQRSNNEDSYTIHQEQELYILADGMGGHQSGEIASRLAVDKISEFMLEKRHRDDFEWPYNVGAERNFEERSIINSVMWANERVFVESMKDRSMDGMGTTICVAKGHGDNIILAHVGDSRIYRFREGKVEQLTEDHSLLNHYLKTGKIRPEDADKFKNKNVIIRAVGLKDWVDVDIQVEKKVPGDVYLMCSDGLSDLVESWIMGEVISGNFGNLPEIGRTLINLANESGGKDNITVVLFQIMGEADSAVIGEEMPRELEETADITEQAGQEILLDAESYEVMDDSDLPGSSTQQFQLTDFSGFDDEAIGDAAGRKDKSRAGMDGSPMAGKGEFWDVPTDPGSSISAVPEPVPTPKPKSIGAEKVKPKKLTKIPPMQQKAAEGSFDQMQQKARETYKQPISEDAEKWRTAKGFVSAPRVYAKEKPPEPEKPKPSRSLEPASHKDIRATRDDGSGESTIMVDASLFNDSLIDKPIRELDSVSAKGVKPSIPDIPPDIDEAPAADLAKSEPRPKRKALPSEIPIDSGYLSDVVLAGIVVHESKDD